MRYAIYNEASGMWESAEIGGEMVTMTREEGLQLMVRSACEKLIEIREAHGLTPMLSFYDWGPITEDAICEMDGVALREFWAFLGRFGVQSVEMEGNSPADIIEWSEILPKEIIRAWIETL